MDADITLGEFIKKKRKELGLSLRGLAEKSSLSHTYISQLEKGDVKIPSLDTLLKLSKALSVNLETFAQKISNHEEIFYLFSQSVDKLDENLCNSTSDLDEDDLHKNASDALADIILYANSLDSDAFNNIILSKEEYEEVLQSVIFAIKLKIEEIRAKNKNSN